MKTILIIDDEAKLRGLLARILQLEGYETVEAGTAREAWPKLAQHTIDLVLCDVKLPDANGIALSAQIREKYPQPEIVLLTAHGQIADAVQAMREGAFDYLVKGNDNERILPVVIRAIEKVELKRRIGQLEQQIGERHSFERIIGQSAAMSQALDLARRVAQTDTTVLLTGETGTGKEVFAQSIHRASPRRSQAFVAINCSAVSREILESELFGHKAGAFTGAAKDKKGLIEEANKGTLFLDEIGEMPLELQAKLLRVLETGEYIKVGDTKPQQANLRIIAATNRNLQQEVATQHFRQDLYYRLSVFSIHLPALRERKEDIRPLAEHYLHLFARKMVRGIEGFSSAAQKSMCAYTWPGNVRELRNAVERAVILATDNLVLAEHLPFTDDPLPQETHNTLSAFSLASAEKLQIQKVLNHTQGNKPEAAKLLGIGLTTLYRKIEQYGIFSF